MRTIIICALVCLVIALALPLLLSPGAGRVTAETASPAPETEAPALADADYTFTVLTNGEVVTVTMADWLPGVVAAEMPALFGEEALKAQAVAARTYIMSRKRLGTQNHPEADVCDDSSCCKAHVTDAEMRENWGGDYDEYMAKILSAVTATDGQYLTYEGEAIQAVFHSSSAGMTEASSALWNATPYLVSVSSPETAQDVPNYVTTAEFTASDFAAALESVMPDGFPGGEDPSSWLGGTVLDDSGRVDTVTVCGTAVSGSDMRTIFSLRSTAFTLGYTESGTFLFTVTGSGHGVGMSQYGANVMAQNGSGYAEILAHYYPGTELFIP